MVNRQFRTKVVVVIALATATAMLVVPLASARSARPPVRIARTVNTTETVRLHLVRKSGSTLSERGSASGTFAGPVTAQFTIRLIVFVSGSVTIHARGGSLTLSVSGKADSAGTRARFSGSMRVSKGTGRFAHARGTGTFKGTVNRRSWAATVTARGRLSY